MKYLTIENIIQIHYETVQNTQSKHGIDNPRLLQSALLLSQSTISGKDSYSKLTQKAARLVNSLVLDKPFTSANKSTAAMCMLEFLLLNSEELEVTNKELREFLNWIEAKRPKIEEIAKWIKRHSA